MVVAFPLNFWGGSVLLGNPRRDLDDQIGSEAFLATRPSVERIDQSLERHASCCWKEIVDKSKFPEEFRKIPVIPFGERIPVPHTLRRIHVNGG